MLATSFHYAIVLRDRSHNPIPFYHLQHADPHGGNIFVLKDGSVGLIDFGQVKQISGRSRETLCKLMIALADRESDTNPADLARVGELAIELGVTLQPDAQPEAPAAVGMWLFDGSVETLPGGYDKGELSPNSPVRELQSFPQDLVLVGRSTILIKGLSSRLGIPWSLAQEWAPVARQVLADPLRNTSRQTGRVRFRQVRHLLGHWWSGRTSKWVTKLPQPLRRRLAALLVSREERRKNRTSS